MKISEKDLRNLVREAIENVTNNIEDEEDYPADVIEWAKKVQTLGLELSRLCGKYRFSNEELYQTLDSIQTEYNAVCGDLNTYGISSHWSC